MNKGSVKVNEAGRRIGESHPRAKLTDADVALLNAMLDERRRVIEYLESAGTHWHVIGTILNANELSYRLIAMKFEISKGHVSDIDSGRRRCQTPSA